MQEHDGHGQSMCQRCVRVLIFQQAAQKKITVQHKVTSVEEPPTMTVVPLYRDSLNLPWELLNNSLYTANECPTYI